MNVPDAILNSKVSWRGIHERLFGINPGRHHSIDARVG